MDDELNPTMKHEHIITYKFVGIEQLKSLIISNKPIYVGMTMLDLSKFYMYRCFYDVFTS